MCENCFPMCFLSLIKDSYYHETLLEARKLEKLEFNLPNLELQEFFNLRCLANKVTPKPLQIKMERQKFEQATIKKAECSHIPIESSVQISRSTTSKLK